MVRRASASIRCEPCSSITTSAVSVLIRFVFGAAMSSLFTLLLLLPPAVLVVSTLPFPLPSVSR